MDKMTDLEITQLWYLSGCVERSKEALMQAKNIVLAMSTTEDPETVAVCNLLVEKHQEDLEFNKESLDVFLSDFDSDIIQLLEGIS